MEGVQGNQQVFQLDVTVQNPAVTAHLSCVCCLPHDNPCQILTNRVALQKLIQGLAGHGPLEDHDVVVRLHLPVQKLDDLRNPGLVVRMIVQSDL